MKQIADDKPRRGRPKKYHSPEDRAAARIKSRDQRSTVEVKEDAIKALNDAHVLLERNLGIPLTRTQAVTLLSLNYIRNNGDQSCSR